MSKMIVIKYGCFGHFIRIYTHEWAVRCNYSAQSQTAFVA